MFGEWTEIVLLRSDANGAEMSIGDCGPVAHFHPSTYCHCAGGANPE